MFVCICICWESQWESIGLAFKLLKQSEILDGWSANRFKRVCTSHLGSDRFGSERTIGIDLVVFGQVNRSLWMTCDAYAHVSACLYMYMEMMEVMEGLSVQVVLARKEQ